MMNADLYTFNPPWSFLILLSYKFHKEFLNTLSALLIFSVEYLAEMSWHELYIYNYCTSRVILHEAQSSVIFLYKSNNYRNTTSASLISALHHVWIFFRMENRNFTFVITAGYSRCILPLYIDKYTTADSFVLVVWHDIMTKTRWVIFFIFIFLAFFFYFSP